jgi:sugar phosphate isomerase/epimerase
MVLMETHGDLVWTQDIDKIMQNASHSNVGLVWDPCNMWTITKEPPSEAYRILKKIYSSCTYQRCKACGRQTAVR